MTEINQTLPDDRTDRYIAGDTALINATVDLTDSNDTDLGSADISFVLARYPGDTPFVTKSRDDGISVVDAAAGEIEIRIDPSDTESLGRPGGEDYYFEIEVTDSVGDVATVTTCEWTIYPNTA